MRIALTKNKQVYYNIKLICQKPKGLPPQAAVGSKRQQKRGRARPKFGKHIRTLIGFSEGANYLFVGEGPQ